MSESSCPVYGQWPCKLRLTRTVKGVAVLNTPRLPADSLPPPRRPRPGQGTNQDSTVNAARRKSQDDTLRFYTTRSDGWWWSSDGMTRRRGAAPAIQRASPELLEASASAKPPVAHKQHTCHTTSSNKFNTTEYDRPLVRFARRHTWISAAPSTPPSFARFLAPPFPCFFFP
jgi:hypothetical protein